jgi:hypothetical protein
MDGLACRNRVYVKKNQRVVVEYVEKPMYWMWLENEVGSTCVCVDGRIDDKTQKKHREKKLESNIIVDGRRLKGKRENDGAGKRGNEVEMVRNLISSREKKLETK